MQKFPLRMKDNDLLVTELYHDPSNDAITALSVYLTPKTSMYVTCEQPKIKYCLKITYVIKCNHNSLMKTREYLDNCNRLHNSALVNFGCK